MPELDSKTQKAVDDITSGTLAIQIKRNMRYATSGAAIGAVAGFVIAMLTGKCRICYTFWGALAGGGIGYLSSKK